MGQKLEKSLILFSVVDLGCLSRIQKDVYPITATNKPGGNFFVLPFWRHKYHKIKLFLVLKTDNEKYLSLYAENCSTFYPNICH